MRSLTVLAAASSAAIAAAAPGNWSIIATGFGAFSTGVSFNADGKTGFLVAAPDGKGATIHKSIDGGKTWADTKDAPELIPLDVTSYGTYVATVGALVFGEYSNNTGLTFQSSNLTNDAGGDAQCIRNYGPHDSPSGFIAFGQFGVFSDVTNGVAISRNGGRTYTAQNITALQTSVRYGCSPDANTIYVTAGQWPDSGDDQPSESSNTIRVTARTSIVRDANGSPRFAFNDAPRTVRRALRSRGAVAATPSPAPGSGYMAQIAKSTDGGASFSSVFFSTDIGYFNGIDCLDAMHCCAGAEQDDIPGGFGSVTCTFDGGVTWNQTWTMHNTATMGVTVFDVRAVGVSSYWAVGGMMTQESSTALFIYSADQGRTWTATSTIPGNTASSVDCAQGTAECWATLLDATTQVASLAYVSGI